MSNPHEDTFIQSKILISRNKKYFMSTEKKVPDYRHSLWMQYLKNTTRLHNRKYVMIEQQISPPYVKPLGDSSKYLTISPNHHTSTH